MIPTINDMLESTLLLLADKKSYHKKQITEHMFTKFNLTKEEQSQTIPSGQNKIYNIVNWTCVELRGAGFITLEENKATITKQGIKVLEQKPDKIDYKFLETIPKYQKWLNKNKQFSFVKKDFDSLTGKKDDAKYLASRFKNLRIVLQKNLSDEFDKSSGYTARPASRPDRNGNVKWYDYLWLGIVLDYALFNRKQESIQFQVSIKKQQMSCHIWASWVAKDRILVLQNQITQNSAQFMQILKKLPENYTLRASNRGKNVSREFLISDITQDSLGEINDTLNNKSPEFFLGVTWSEKDALEMGDSVVKKLADTFDSLLPAYKFLNGEDYKHSVLTDRPAGEFEKYDKMLHKKPQIILYGPPGTGKTYTADLIASWLTSKKPNSELIRHVTFHPSYSYEEFVEGLKPDSKGNYFIQDGIFKKICADAKADPDHTYVLVIDEINRGRTEKIFGELITLIEGDKRGRRSAYLAYSQEMFTVPENLRIIGTMNTADRSLTYLDAALRRRFGFFEMMPDYSLVKGVVNDIHLDRLLAKLNSKIREHEGREKQVGHSYFMFDGKPIQTIEKLQSAFTHEIIPLLQDYFYEDYEKLHMILGDAFVDKKNMEIRDLQDNMFADALKKIYDENNKDEGAPDQHA